MAMSSFCFFEPDLVSCEYLVIISLSVCLTVLIWCYCILYVIRLRRNKRPPINGIDLDESKKGSRDHNSKSADDEEKHDTPSCISSMPEESFDAKKYYHVKENDEQEDYVVDESVEYNRGWGRDVCLSPIFNLYPHDGDNSTCSLVPDHVLQRAQSAQNVLSKRGKVKTLISSLFNARMSSSGGPRSWGDISGTNSTSPHTMSLNEQTQYDEVVPDSDSWNERNDTEYHDQYSGQGSGPGYDTDPPASMTSADWSTVGHFDTAIRAALDAGAPSERNLAVPPSPLAALRGMLPPPRLAAPSSSSTLQEEWRPSRRDDRGNAGSNDWVPSASASTSTSASASSVHISRPDDVSYPPMGGLNGPFEQALFDSVRHPTAPLLDPRPVSSDTSLSTRYHTGSTTMHRSYVGPVSGPNFMAPPASTLPPPSPGVHWADQSHFASHAHSDVGGASGGIGRTGNGEYRHYSNIAGDISHSRDSRDVRLNPPDWTGNNNQSWSNREGKVGYNSNMIKHTVDEPKWASDTTFSKSTVPPDFASKDSSLAIKPGPGFRSLSVGRQRPPVSGPPELDQILGSSTFSPNFLVRTSDLSQSLPLSDSSSLHSSISSMRALLTKPRQDQSRRPLVAPPDL